MEKYIEKWSSKIFEVAIGNIKIGGQSTLPSLYFEGNIPNKPKVAIEIFDIPPAELWPSLYPKYKDFMDEPIKWIKKAEEFQPDLICFKFLSCHPDISNNSAEYAKELTKRIIENTSLPLILLGPGHIEKDAEIIPYVSEAAKGRKVLLGMATKDNYRTFCAAALADEHSIIAETPIDINLEKQLNILISDAGLPIEKIVIHPVTAGLGYGFEYCYSVMERTRLAGLGGDKIMACPIINMVGEETWDVKEATVSEEEMQSWGNLDRRSIAWEIASSIGYLQAGSDILVVANPSSLPILKKMIEKM